jgi:chromate transport protein ChrA
MIIFMAAVILASWVVVLLLIKTLHSFTDKRAAKKDVARKD